MLNEKIKSYVGFAIKSGAVLYGTDQIITSRKVRLVLLDPTLSENSRKKLLTHCQTYGICCMDIDICGILPAKNCKALGILNVNLAEAVISEIKEK